MKFTHFFIARPIFAIVLSLLMLLAGAIAFLKLPLSEYPAVTPPTVQVSASYPGANPQVIADTVAAPLEQVINGVDGMLYMNTQMAIDGRMVISIAFEQGTDPDMAQIQVQNRVSRALPRLPEEVQRIGVVTEKTSPDMLMVVHLVSPQKRYDSLYLSNFAIRQFATNWPVYPASAMFSSGARASTPCASGWTRRKSPTAVLPPVISLRRCGNKTYRSPPVPSGNSRRPPPLFR